MTDRNNNPAFMRIFSTCFQAGIEFLSYDRQHDQVVQQESGPIDGYSLFEVSHRLQQRHSRGESRKSK